MDRLTQAAYEKKNVFARASACYKAALYMRLSKDDDGTGESSSIGTQRKMLRSYAIENDFEIYGEYVDDGYSGTNFDRPSWKRLLKDIDARKVNLVITKDLSRLGRDYIMTGQLTEIYFPSRGIRYIAVNDGYDSDSPWSDIAPFKNIVNEMYARDTSKKIRSAFQTKINEGAFIGNFAPYGYQKDPQNKNHLLVDPVAASIVREIFEWAEQGAAPSQIAEILNKRKVLTPAMYRCAERPYLNLDDYSRRKEWTSGTVCKLLSNPVYLGHIVQGKTVKVSFKSSMTLRKPRNEWVVVKDKHEPLISGETYERVRRRSVSRKSTAVTGFTNVFSGLAKCGDCGRNMSSTGAGGKAKSRKLVCGGYKLYGRKECTNHFMDYELLYYVVLQEIRSLLSFTESEKEEIEETLREPVSPGEMQGEEKAVFSLKNRKKELGHIIEKLYEDRVNERISEDRFYIMLDSFEKEEKKIAESLAMMERPCSLVQESEPASDGLLSSLLEDMSQEKGLSSDLLGKFIDRIEIYQSSEGGEGKAGRKYQTIRIYYKVAPIEDRNGLA
ncbi:recombinase family protein [Lacrimispora sphenoides]|uniref:Site-specific DNA recombinase n=1 Tax=Lacrimispora sphenoides JCM 1415 TaxID=1297793 RepID=A0ABY1CC66_9FIRM|nr:recombinase family protein [Lacrimispora sphenoides]SET91657.1 Site-specific DNA recombinase [[Clostridium] sphenoides JCM 1415]SUY52330.1 recombinase [Lacrimispora sphenoides]